MAVYTLLSDEDIDDIRKAFGLGEVLAFKGIAEGVSNSNYFLETADGRFILTIYEAMVNKNDLPFYLGATEYAAKMGLDTALPLHTIEGNLTFEIEGKSCAICSFLNGYSPRTPNVKQVKSAGRALAMLHNALEDYELKRENDLGPNDWLRLWDTCKNEAEALETGVRALIDSDIERISQSWPHGEELPKGFIHADLFPDNVLFTGNEVSGLIDFYYGCTDFFAYDLAIMLNAWCFINNGREYDITKGNALISGYESVRKLSDKEKELLPLFALGGALRFFLTRMIDWNKEMEGAIVTKKDPREYSARLAFHRAAKSAFDYGVL